MMKEVQQRNSPLNVLKRQLVQPRTLLEEVPSHFPRDIDIYPAYNVICGPMSATVLRGTKWSVPDYPKASETFNVVKGLQRQSEYERLFAPST